MLGFFSSEGSVIDAKRVLSVSPSVEEVSTMISSLETPSGASYSISVNATQTAISSVTSSTTAASSDSSTSEISSSIVLEREQLFPQTVEGAVVTSMYVEMEAAFKASLLETNTGG